MSFHHVNVPVDDNEFGSIAYGWQVEVKKGDCNEVLSEENYIKVKNSHAVLYIARRIGIMPHLKKKKISN